MGEVMGPEYDAAWRATAAEAVASRKARERFDPQIDELKSRVKFLEERVALLESRQEL